LVTEKQARLASARFYMTPEGKVLEIAGAAHLEDERGRIVVECDGGEVILERVEFTR